MIVFAACCSGLSTHEAMAYIAATKDGDIISDGEPKLSDAYSGLYRSGHNGWIQLKYVCSKRVDISGDTAMLPTGAGDGFACMCTD